MNKHRALLPVLWIAAGLLASSVQALPGFRPLPEASLEQRTYLDARDMAADLVREALPGLRGRDGLLGRRVLSALQQARILTSTDFRSQRLCATRQYSLFVNAYYHNQIFVCDEVRPHARNPNQDALDRIAQGFVHEAVHLTGEMDECEATRFELAVMNQTIGIKSRGSQIRYGAQCRGRW